jgi:hypothetical protein
MNYNTNRTIQAVCAKAIIYQTDQYRSSCNNIYMATEIAWFGFEAEDSLRKDYRTSLWRLQTDRYGFHPFSLKSGFSFLQKPSKPTASRCSTTSGLPTKTAWMLSANL